MTTPPKPPTPAEGNGATPQRPMIELVHFTKEYDGFRAVNDITLSVAEGEFFCVLGPNGAGKTSTIKTLVGLLRPTSGTVRVGGWDVQTHPVEAKRLIGYIPDMPYLYDKLSGRDMFRFVADLFGVPWPEAQQRLEYFANLFKLDHVIDQLIENYSHGMRQKLCFSMALMHEPRVIIVDEPFVGLDPQSARIVKNLLRDECKRGACVFLSTHTLDVAEELSDRIAIYKRGDVIFLGTMDELRAQQGANRRNLEEYFLDLTMEEGDEVRLRTGMWQD